MDCCYFVASTVFFAVDGTIVKVASAGMNSTPSTGIANVTRTETEVASSGTRIASTEAE